MTRTLVREGIFRSAAVVLLAALAFVAGSALAAEPADAQLEEMRAKMAQLRSDMRDIERERDPAERHRLLAAHMADMHEAMSLIQNEIMPDMRRRMGGSRMVGVQHAEATGGMDMESEAHLMHMETMMEATMVEMSNLLEVMNAHRAAVQSSP